MTVDVTAIANKLQELPPGKYFRDARRVASLIDIPQEDLFEFFTAIKRCGQGNCSNETWRPNPPPYNGYIDIESQAEENILNLHKQSFGNENGDHSVLAEPSPGILRELCDYCLLGSSRLRSVKLAKVITPSYQREMVGMVIGQNQNLSNQYPELAEERRRIWRDWGDRYKLFIKADESPHAAKIKEQLECAAPLTKLTNNSVRVSVIVSNTTSNY